MKRKALVYTLLLLVGPSVAMLACGPDFAPDIFVPAHRPVVPKNYAKGQLGVLQPGYFIADKVVAYRYLNGGTLNDDEQRQLAPVAAPGLDYDHMSDDELKAAQTPDTTPTALDRWNTARRDYGAGGGAVQGKPKEVTPSTQGGWNADIVNCGDNAFDTAAATLADRTAKWGKGSAALRDWVTAQDAVFAHCSGDGPMPAAVAAGAPLLLKQDRAYQIAAATFYSGEYAAARDAFLAIANEKASPWSKWGTYLAARSIVRQAGQVASGKDDSAQAQFDLAGLQKARELLVQAIASTDPHVKHAAQAELDFVMIRLDPEKQAAMLANELAGPGHDPDFGQHVVDLRFLLDHEKHGDAPLIRWMTLTGSPLRYSVAPTPGKPMMALSPVAEWQKHPDFPGFIAALMSAKTATPALMEAAAAVPESSPAYITVQFHRARLMTEANDLQGARDVTTHALALTRKRDEFAATNALLEVRMKTARDLASLLQDAARTMISLQSESAASAGCASWEEAKCRSKIPAMQFDEDAAQLFNTRMPLSIWVDSATSDALPKHLRDTMALSGWLRALILGRDDEAKKLIPLLPAPVQASLGKSDDPTGYAATLVLLHSPGLRPFLDAGVQRAVSYTALDSYRNNLWCSTMAQALGPDPGEGNAPTLPVSKPAFLTPEQEQQARSEVAALDAHPIGMDWLGRRTIDYVKGHPADPAAAESLALVVKLTRYECSLPNGYGKSPSSGVSKEAFTLLHSRYPNSDWAAKTKYYF